MKIIYKKNSLNILNNKKNIIVNNLSLNTFLNVLNKFDTEIYNYLISEFERDKFFKIGFSSIIQKFNKSLKESDITKVFISLLKYPQEQICELGRHIYDNDFEIIKDANILKDDFKFLLSGKNVSLINSLSIFEDYPNVKVVFLIDNSDTIKIICKEAYELYNKKAFKHLKDKKCEINLNNTDPDFAIKIFRELELEDIEDNKSYEIDELRRFKDVLNEKDYEFFKEVKDAFIDGFKNLLSIQKEDEIDEELFNLLIQDLGLGDLFNTNSNKEKVNEKEFIHK